MKLVEQLVVSPAELTLLAELGGLSPLLPLDPPDLDDGGRRAVADGLLARGVLALRDGEPGLADAVQPLLGVALLAARATFVQFQSLAEERSVTLLSAGEIVVVHDRVEGILHRFAPADPDGLPDLLGLVLDLPALASRGAPDSSVRSPTSDDLLDRLSALAATDDDRWSLRMVDVAEQTGDAVLGVRTVLALDSADGLWLADGGAGDPDLPVELADGQRVCERLLAATGIRA